jgi:hypothetical protein
MAGVINARIINQAQIEAAIVDAFEEWLDEDVNDKFFSEQFLTDKWQYPPPSTQRKNGEIAGNPRNIVDLGNLFRSGQESFGIVRGSTLIEGKWHWDAENSSGQEYAWYVHEGEGPYSRAPRPWTDEIAEPYLFASSDVKRDLEFRIEGKFAK